MRKFLIATHGSFAEGIKSSLEMIAGSNENVHIIGAYTDGNKSIEEDLDRVLLQVGRNDELIVFTDLAGGSITSEILRLVQGENIYVVAGINLPLLLETVLADPDAPAEEVIENGISSARDQIMFVSRILKQTSLK